METVCAPREASEARLADVQIGGLMIAGLLSWGSQMCMTQALQMSKTLGVLIVRYTGKPVDKLVSCMQDGALTRPRDGCFMY
jgi:hypothetical protein